MEGKKRKELNQWVSEWVCGKNGKMARWQVPKVPRSGIPRIGRFRRILRDSFGNGKMIITV